MDKRVLCETLKKIPKIIHEMFEKQPTQYRELFERVGANDIVALAETLKRIDDKYCR